MRNKKLNYRMYLSQSKVKSPFEFFHKFFENFVFFRWMFFKNRPRSIFLLIRAFLITGMLFFFYALTLKKLSLVIVGMKVEPIFVFTSLGILGYWNMLNGFYSKNNYCSHLYNDYIKEKARGNELSSKILSLNLSNQLLAMDLWSHRVYSPDFVKNLEESIEFCYSEKNEYFKPSYSSADECYQAANNKKLTVGEARNILLSIQYSLEDQISKSNGINQQDRNIA